MSADQIVHVRSALEKMQPQFQMVLPPHVPVERFMRIVQTAIQQNDHLLNADRKSLLSACMKAAQDGLLPDGREAALVTFRTKAGPMVQYMPMVAGILKKARNSGEIKTINALVVYSNDQYEHWVDETGEHFKHKRAYGPRGAPMLTYAYAITKDGGFYFEETDEKDIESIRKASRAKDSGPWSGPFADEMRRKSAIRRLAKYRLPSSTDLEDTIRADDDFYNLDKDPPTTVSDAPSRVEKIIETKTEEMRQEEETKTKNPSEEEQSEGPF